MLNTTFFRYISNNCSAYCSQCRIPKILQRSCSYICMIQVNYIMWCYSGKEYPLTYTSIMFSVLTLVITNEQRPSFSWLYGSWIYIYNYMSNQCLSPAVSSNRVRAKVYSIQHHVIKFVSDLQQVGGFLWVLRFRPATNKTDRHDYLKYSVLKSGVKHHYHFQFNFSLLLLDKIQRRQLFRLSQS